MPARWFYSFEDIRKTLDGGPAEYEDAPHLHPESFMVVMTCHPDEATVKKLDRPLHVLHERGRFCERS